MTLFEGFLAQVGKGIAVAATVVGKDRFKRWRAARQAAEGGPGAELLSLNSLVREQLDALAKTSDLEHFRDWLLSIGQEERFADLLVNSHRGSSELATVAQRELAASYARTSGESVKAASGPINQVLSHLVKVIPATEVGQQALQTALMMRVAAGQDAMLQSAGTALAASEVIPRVRVMAENLLKAGAQNWSMPAHVVTLSLDKRLGRDLAERDPLEFDQTSDFVDRAGRVVVFGDGGVGKTTLLLHTGATLLAGGRRIPIFLDAASWARTGKGLLEYIATREQALGAQVTPPTLAKLALDGNLLLLINGWNEIAGKHKARCHTDLVDLAATYPALGIVVATRGHRDFSAQDGTQFLEVLGLTWKEQVAAIISKLPAPAADSLVSLLARNSGLRYATRSPLILQGALIKASLGDITSASTLDFIDAAIQSFERNVQHSSALQQAPVHEHFRVYLQAVAFQLTASVQTVCDRNDALRALTHTARQLQEDGVLLAPPDVSEVLNTLVNHHLLQIDDGGIRFAHQRFQEYFAASRVLADSAAPNGHRAALKLAVRGAGWEEVLSLVANDLRKPHLSAARVALVEEAVAVDLGLACDLAGESELQPADDKALYERLVRKVNALASSPLREVRDLATCLQIACTWPVFSEQLLPFLEHTDQQVRLTTYRLSNRGITLRQLGPGAGERVAAWPHERQSEFIHEVADNPENFDYVEQIARTPAHPDLQEAAISALLWNYPASDSGLRAWVAASTPVRMSLLGHISDTLDRVPEPAYVTQALEEMANTLGDVEQVRFARQFPDRTTTRAIAGLLDQLKTIDDSRNNDDTVLNVALRLAAPDVLELARELALERRKLPQWSWSLLERQPEGGLTQLRESLTTKLLGDQWASTDADFIGKVASIESSSSVLDAWLVEDSANRTASGPRNYGRARHLHDVLVAIDGQMLATAVSIRAQRSTYSEAVRLTELLLQRADRQVSQLRPMVSPWRPTVAQIQRLQDSFAGVADPNDDQDSLRVYLASLCSKVSPSDFETYILDAFAAQLELLSAYQNKIASWGGAAPRPSGPSLRNYIVTAAAACGFPAVPKLLSFSSHPQAKELLPDTLAQIAIAPWQTLTEQPRFSLSVCTCILEGKNRSRLARTALQPDDEFQATTDDIARYLAQELESRLALAASQPGDRAAEHQVARWTEFTSKVPSPIVVPIVKGVLGSGFLNKYATVTIAKDLLRLGEQLAEPECVRHIESFLEPEATKWVNDSDRYSVTELATLLVCAVPDSFLSRPWGYYFDIWLKEGHEHSVLGECRTGGCLRAWEILEPRLSSKGDFSEGAAEALMRIVDAQSLPRLLTHVRSGALFVSPTSSWRVKQLTSIIVSVLQAAPEQTHDFIEACSSSSAPAANAFLIRALEQLGHSREVQTEYLLDAFDAGRMTSMHSPGISAMDALFANHRVISENTSEVSPAACNALRVGLYHRAMTGVGPSELAKRFLAALECSRREGVRPDEEQRHPDPSDGKEWMEVFL